ncbi:MAG: AsmA family protein [Deltaproteobacteria bacterium]
MSKSTKILLFALGGLVGLFVLIVTALLLFVNANAFKARLETAASNALGMEVKVDGRMGFGFAPGLFVTLKDVHIRNRGADVASAGEARLGIDLLPLLKKDVRVETISLQHPRISIERNRAGQFNFERLEAAEKTLSAKGFSRVSLAGGTFLYADQQSGEGFEALDCDLEVRHLRFSGGRSKDLMRNLSFTAELACGEIRKKDFKVSGLKVSAAGKKGDFDLQPVTMRIFGAQGTGSVHADFSGRVPRYSVHYALPQFHIEEFFKSLSPQKVAAGTMDFTAQLSLQGTTLKTMRQSLTGRISLRGRNLTLRGRDLDQDLSRYEASQHFNLVDVGAFFFAGPLGLVVTKGYNFAGLLQGSEGSSEIRTLVSDWKVENGVARAQDVALATKEHRVALKGGLDFVNQRFDDVTVALIDDQGCAKVRQRILGSFQKPVVEKPSLLSTLTGPAMKLLKKGMVKPPK